MKYLKLFEEIFRDHLKGGLRYYANNAFILGEKYYRLFVDRMLQFYGKGGIYSETFGGLTEEIINKYADKYIEKRYKLGLWSGGDTFDREYFRDVLLIKLGITGDTEYNVDPYLTKSDKIRKDAMKYNL